MSVWYCEGLIDCLVVYNRVCVVLLARKCCELTPGGRGREGEGRGGGGVDVHCTVLVD